MKLLPASDCVFEHGLYFFHKNGLLYHKWRCPSQEVYPGGSPWRYFGGSIFINSSKADADIQNSYQQSLAKLIVE